jgi:hypothetical protein
MNKILKITIAVVLCLIVILAVALLVSQCSKNKPEETTSTTSTTKPTTPPPPVCTEHVDTNTDYLCDVCGKEIEKPVDTLITTNDKVYVISTELNLRKTPNETGTASVSVKIDAELNRIGYYTEGENAGFSKILYNEVEYYVLTSCVTTQKPIVINDGEPETVYLIMNTIAYSKPSLISEHHYSDAMDTLYKDKEVVRLGVATEVYADGNITFAKIKYTNSLGKEVILYVDNDALSTEKFNPDGEVVFDNTSKIIVSKLLADEEFWVRKSTIYKDSETAFKLKGGTALQAIGFGTESDGTVWAKILYKGQTYYVIYKSVNKGLYFNDGIFGEYNISTLPNGLETVTAGKAQYTLSSGNIAIDVTKTDELPEGITAQYFAGAMIEELSLSGVQVQEKNGVVYFEFETSATVGDQTSNVYCLVVITAGNKNNFYVTTLAVEGTKADSADTLWGYADTIKVSPKA